MKKALLAAALAACCLLLSGCSDSNYQRVDFEYYFTNARWTPDKGSVWLDSALVSWKDYKACDQIQIKFYWKDTKVVSGDWKIPSYDEVMVVYTVSSNCMLYKGEFSM